MQLAQLANQRQLLFDTYSPVFEFWAQVKPGEKRGVMNVTEENLSEKPKKKIKNKKIYQSSMFLHIV